MRNMKSFVAMSVAILILGGGAAIYQVAGISNEKAGDLLVTTGQKLQNASQAAQKNPAGTANAQSLQAIFPTVVTKVATSQVVAVAPQPVVGGTSSGGITAISAAPQSVQTDGAVIELFGVKFNAPGTTIDPLTGKEPANAILLKKEVGNRIAELRELVNRFNITVKMQGSELTEGDAEDTGKAVYSVAKAFTQGVADTHRGKTQRDLATLFQMHAIDGDKAPRLRITRNPYIGNPDAKGAYLIEVEVEDDKWVKADDLGLRVARLTRQNTLTHELTMDLVLAMTTNPEHNSVARVSVYRYTNVMSRGAKLGDSRIAQAELLNQDLTVDQAVAAFSKMSIAEVGAKWLLHLDK